MPPSSKSRALVFLPASHSSRSVYPVFRYAFPRLSCISYVSLHVTHNSFARGRFSRNEHSSQGRRNLGHEGQSNVGGTGRKAEVRMEPTRKKEKRARLERRLALRKSRISTYPKFQPVLGSHSASFPT